MPEKKITLNMITCRTIQQGVGMEAGKTSQKYFDACTVIHMHPDDFKRLGYGRTPMSRSRVRSAASIVKAVETSEDLVPGLAHIPMGPWANQIVPAYTFSTGEPCFKGFPVDVEIAANERIMGAVEVLQDACGLLRK